MRGRSPALGYSPAAACAGTATGRRSCLSRRTFQLEVTRHHQKVLKREWPRSPSPCYLKRPIMSKNRFLTVLRGCNFYLGNSVLKYWCSVFYDFMLVSPLYVFLAAIQTELKVLTLNWNSQQWWAVESFSWMWCQQQLHKGKSMMCHDISNTYKKTHNQTQVLLSALRSGLLPELQILIIIKWNKIIGLALKTCNETVCNGLSEVWTSLMSFALDSRPQGDPGREAVFFCWFHQEGRAVKLPQVDLG